MCFPLDPSTPTNRCSDQQMNEWVSAQLDHREKLESWSALWFYLCGPKRGPEEAR